MAWWLDLSDHPPDAVQLVDGDPALVVVWIAPQTVQFYAQHNGAAYGNLTVLPPPGANPTSETWREFLESLRAPNSAYLPVVDTGSMVIYASYDGQLCIYHQPGEPLILAVDGQRTAFDRTPDPVAVGLDRELGTVGVLSAEGRLHVYQQHMFIGAYPVVAAGETTLILLPDLTDTILLVDDVRIQVFDMAGVVQRSLDPPAVIGTAACSPDGRWLVTADRDQAFLRVYDGDLRFVRQGSAWDLWAGAVQLQLLAAPPFVDALAGSLAVVNDGTLAFALGGSLCLAHTDQLTPVPQPRALF